MVNLFGLFELPWFELIISLLIIFGIVRWYVVRIISTHKVKILLTNKTETEGRIFPAEESLTENRISAIKRVNWKKTERLDFEKVEEPLQIYIGSKKETIFKAVEGINKTNSWKMSSKGEGGAVSLLYTEAGKFNAGLSALSKVALKNTSARMMDVLTGLLLGMVITLVMTMIFPQVF